MHHKRGFEHRQIVGDGRPADLTEGSKPGRFKNSSALRHEKFSKSGKRVPQFQSKEFRDVFRPVRIHPFLAIPLGKLRRQEEGWL